MPETSSSDTLIDSLRDYTPGAVERAIEAAKSPDVAATLIAYLDRQTAPGNKPAVDFASTAVCVALGEARVESAIPSLIRAASKDAPEESVFCQPAIFALQRIGPAAFDAVMAAIDPNPDSSTVPSLYDVLLAAADFDQSARDRVADFCLSRLQQSIDLPVREDSLFHPAIACAQILIMLRDHRVKPFFEALDELVTFEGNFEEDLEAGMPPSGARLLWHAPWPWMCQEFSLMVEDLQFDNEPMPLKDLFEKDDGSADSASEDEDLEEDDESFDEDPFDEDELDEYDLLAREFEASAHAQGLAYPPEIAAGKMNQFLQMGLENSYGDFAIHDLRDVRMLLYEVLPRTMTARLEYFANFPDVLAAFARFMHETGRLPYPRYILALADEAKTKLPQLAADSENWGMAKTQLMRGFDAGIDVTDPEQAQQYLDSIALPPLPPAPAYERPKPLRREAPKVGRNDPCPCGSGKKYKKCCGK